MSRKKGLSVDEKRSRMMDFFYEKKDFFQLKEMERMCQKEKGITSMSVKDILTSLVDDGMVDTDKIGTSVYFWAFPSKASQNRKRKISDLTGRLDELEGKQRSLEGQVVKAKVGKEETSEREEALSRLTDVRGKRQAVMTELEQYKECDPEVLKQVKVDTVVAKDAANRWTAIFQQYHSGGMFIEEFIALPDNIFSTKSWIKRKFSFEDSMIDKQFGLPDDFDYVE